MTYRDLCTLYDLGFVFSFDVVHVSGRGYCVYVRSSSRHSSELRTSRGHRRFFKSLDTLHKFADSFGAPISFHDFHSELS